MYDEENNSWKEFRSLCIPQSHCMTGIVEGRVVCIGGQGENTIEVTIIPPARILTPSRHLCTHSLY